MQQDRVHVRLLIIAGVAFLWMGAVFGRLSYLQLYRHSEYLSRALRQQQRTFEITPERGAIYDRNENRWDRRIRLAPHFVVPPGVGKKNGRGRFFWGGGKTPQEEFKPGF